MLVFVTGASGFIGRAVISELVSHGHSVLGLVRSDSAAETIRQLGAEPVRGDIEDVASLSAGARRADGIIHLAFNHDFTNFEHALATDKAAIAALVDAIHGSGKPLVLASGTMMIPKGVLGTEDTDFERDTVFGARARNQDIAVAHSVANGIRGSAVRLAPTVHGDGDKGFITMLGGGATQRGFAIYIADGASRWPAVHRLDAAVLFRLALEKGVAGGVYHAVAEEGIAVKTIMETVGKKINVPAESKTMEEAEKAMGFLAYVLAADNPSSSAKTQAELGWKPTQPRLLEDIESVYF